MIFVPKSNVWRIERAARAAVLADGAAYFKAVREAFLQAQRSIFIVGWDIDSRTRLVGATGEPEDGYPADLAEFLSALAEERPSLAIHVLLWDYSILYSLEREPFPMVNLQWKTASRVRFSLDSCVPVGSSQHQKLVIVDDVLAFSGGLDLTVRRWDTPAHAATNPHRVDPAGEPYRPFHDVQIMVDGNAALALAELARARWQAATSEKMPVSNGFVDRWPPSVPPDFTEVEIGIARTEPCGEEVEEDVREVEQLFLASIAAAERTIYIENQFLTSLKIAEALGSRMRERPELEVLFVAPLTHDSWLAESAMCNGRIRFIRILTQAGVGDRVRLTYPAVDAAEPTHTMIHSKVMVVDDRFLRIGSANLNNRSMGTDTECDLAIEASNDTQRAGILAVRNRLFAEHCGVGADEVAERLASGASLIEVSRTLSGHGHSLRDITDDPQQIDASATYLENLADPEKPLDAAAFISLFAGDRVPRRRLRTAAKIVGVVLLIVGLTLVWQFMPLSDLTDPANIEAAMASVSDNPWSAAIVLAAFVGGGLVAFPVNLLIAATAAAFGPLIGFAYAAAGTLVSALVTYGLGAWLGRAALQNIMGPRLNRIRKSIARKGVLSMATIRLVPLAPFTFVNMVAGASEIRLLDYVLGTAIGMAPGLVVMSALGHQLFVIFTDPSPRHFVLLAAALAIWVGLVIGLQAAVQRARRAHT